ncbi:MAG: hypothetical protein LQ351_006836 [Letrouitia transgressa]|nr:MAG: hypothetical protein LQ351_006836 [Letrouitia transgressa]
MPWQRWGPQGRKQEGESRKLYVLNAVGGDWWIETVRKAMEETYGGGGILAFSYGFVPAVSQAPNTLLVREWQTAYTRGTAASPALAIISTLSYIYLSYSLLFTAYHQVAQLYALSALATCSIVPYTLICMKSVNGKLKNKVQDSMELDRSEEMNESKARKGEHSDELLGWWSILNAGRGMLPFIGACLGIYASVS